MDRMARAMAMWGASRHPPGTDGRLGRGRGRPGGREFAERTHRVKAPTRPPPQPTSPTRGAATCARYLPVAAWASQVGRVCGIASCGITRHAAYTQRPIPGIVRLAVSAAGGPRRGRPQFGAVVIRRYFSLGPCGVAQGADPGVTRNAWVALPPGPYEAGGAGGGAAGGAAGTGPGAPTARSGAEHPECTRRDAAGAEAERGRWRRPRGKCDAEGTAAPPAIPPGDGLKNSVNSPPFRGGGPRWPTLGPLGAAP